MVEVSKRAREALVALGWHLEYRSGVQCRVENEGGVGIASELLRYLGAEEGQGKILSDIRGLLTSTKKEG